MPDKKEVIGLPTNVSREDLKSYIKKWTRDVEGCHIWQLDEFRSGYGFLRIGGAAFALRRIIWWLEHGYLPSGDKMSDTCGQKGCHNIKHLQDRTPQADRRTTLFKDGKSGFNLPRMKPHTVALVWDQINLYGETTVKEAARKHGVSRTCLRKHLRKYDEYLNELSKNSGP